MIWSVYLHYYYSFGIFLLEDDNRGFEFHNAIAGCSTWILNYIENINLCLKVITA